MNTTRENDGIHTNPRTEKISCRMYMDFNIRKNWNDVTSKRFLFVDTIRPNNNGCVAQSTKSLVLYVHHQGPRRYHQIATRVMISSSHVGFFLTMFF